jgi:hypothetical protein
MTAFHHALTYSKLTPHSLNYYKSVKDCLLTPSTVLPIVEHLFSVIVRTEIAITAAASVSVTTRSCGHSSLMFCIYLHNFEEKCYQYTLQDIEDLPSTLIPKSKEI